MATRDEIEQEIANLHSEIIENLTETRWIRFFAYISLSALIIGTASLILINSFIIPIFYNLLQIIGTTFLTIGIILTVIFLFSLTSDTFRDLFFVWIGISQKIYKRRLLYKFLKKTSIVHDVAEDYPKYYLKTIPQEIQEKRKQADSYQRRFIITQSFIILLSTIITSVSGGWLDRYFTFPWLVPILSGLISLITGFSLFLKYREKGANLRQTSDALDLEYKAYMLGHGAYKNIPDQADRLTHFTEQAEILRKEQLQRQQQLEQSSQKEHNQSITPG